VADPGFPIAEVREDGSLVLGKAAGTGGLVSLATVKEQILYEIHDPAAYLTPDVTLDITGVQLGADGHDRVAVRGARGKTRPHQLKATVCMAGGWMGEGEISYAGPNALRRAELAIEILQARVGKLLPSLPVHFDIIGYCSVFSSSSGRRRSLPAGAVAPDVRVRMATRGSDRRMVERAVAEVEALYTTGPAGGGGVRLNVTETLDTASCLIDRELAPSRVELL
jgi:hypothetical protein